MQQLKIMQQRIINSTGRYCDKPHVVVVIVLLLLFYCYLIFEYLVIG